MLVPVYKGRKGFVYVHSEKERERRFLPLFFINYCDEAPNLCTYPSPFRLPPRRRREPRDCYPSLSVGVLVSEMA